MIRAGGDVEDPLDAVVDDLEGDLAAEVDLDPPPGAAQERLGPGGPPQHRADALVEHPVAGEPHPLLEREHRDGVLDERVRAALPRSTRPQPLLRRPGRRVEIDLGRQVALQIVDDRVERVFHISSGAGGATPSGSFRVYRKERLSWSVPFSSWMPWASYFVGGIAFHAYGSVPAYPASHGCIRMMARDAPLMYAFATYGTPVDVLWRRA